VPDAVLDTPAAAGGSALEKISKFLTSSVGNLGGLAVAATLATTQFKTLSELPKTIWKSSPDWLGGVIVLTILLSLVIAMTWEWEQKRRINQYARLGGTLKRGYFTLQPREREEGFDRADNAHVDTLQWVLNSNRSVLYLTGAAHSPISASRAIHIKATFGRQCPSNAYHIRYTDSAFP